MAMRWLKNFQSIINSYDEGGIMLTEYPARVFKFYQDGFRRMTVGKTLWKIIIIKLIIMFGVLKIFFFPNFLNTNFSTDQQRADHVIEQLTRSTGNNY
jgi:hypothetical protein